MAALFQIALYPFTDISTVSIYIYGLFAGCMCLAFVHRLLHLGGSSC